MEEARGGNTGREAGTGRGEWLTQGKKEKKGSASEVRRMCTLKTAPPPRWERQFLTGGLEESVNCAFALLLFPVLSDRNAKRRRARKLKKKKKKRKPNPSHFSFHSLIICQSLSDGRGEASLCRTTTNIHTLPSPCWPSVCKCACLCVRARIPPRYSRTNYTLINVINIH